jgi:hypothetical protein
VASLPASRSYVAFRQHRRAPLLNVNGRPEVCQRDGADQFQGITRPLRPGILRSLLAIRGRHRAKWRRGQADRARLAIKKFRLARLMRAPWAPDHIVIAVLVGFRPAEPKLICLPGEAGPNIRTRWTQMRAMNTWGGRRPCPRHRGRNGAKRNAAAWHCSGAQSARKSFGSKERQVRPPPLWLIERNSC